MTSPFANAAVDLGALGYSCVPLIPPSVSHHKGRGKAPGAYVSGGWRGLDKWQRFKESAPTTFELGMWNRAPDANIGLVLGTGAGAGFHVIAVDVDVVDQDAFDTLMRCLPHSPMRKCGAKGMTAFYRAPNTIKTKCYDDARIPREAKIPRRLVDLLTGFDTRQTVVPPSVHPDGPVYRWLDGPVAASELPVFDEDALEKMEDTLRTLGWDPEAPSTSGIERKPRDPGRQIDPDDIWSETKSAALASLDRWVPALDLYGCRPARGGFEAVATWRASSTGQAIPDRKRNLSIQRDGIKDFGTNDTYSAIDLVMAARDCEQAAATDWLRERLGLKDDGVVIALNVKPDLTNDDLPEPLRVKATVTPDRPQPVTAPVSDSLQVFGGELPDALTRAPGLVGSITDWICDTARKPQRAGALMAALEIVGTAAGRTFSGPTRTGTHLYGLFLAPSGAAKDHPLKAIDRVLRAATLGAHVGPGEFMSMSALVSRLNRQPLTLTCIDEFGGYLGRINGRKASPHEKAITRTLRSAWGSSFDTMATPEWAGRVGEPIFSPALSIYGVSTHEEFFANLDGADVFNGFLNRFLIFSTHARVEEREPLLDKTAVPDAITDGLVAIVASLPPLSRATSHNAASDGPSIIVPWDDKYAHQAYMAFGQECERRELDAVFFTRSAEMAQRMATIRAIGRDGAAARVTLEDMDWGIALARWSAEQTVEMARDYMSENEHDQHVTAVRTAVRKAGEISRSDLVKRVHRQMDSRRLEGVIKMLIDGDMIHETRGPIPLSGGRGKTIYRYGPSPGTA